MNDRTLSSMFRVFAHSGQIQGYRLSGRRAVKIVDKLASLVFAAAFGLYLGWLFWG